MAKSKIHWYRGCGFGKRSSQSVPYTPALFVDQKSINPDWYCWDCAKAARLALAKESAPKRDETSDLDLCDVCFWRKRALNPGAIDELPACKGERSDSERYAELRALVEAWQSHCDGSSIALATWRHR